MHMSRRKILTAVAATAFAITGISGYMTQAQAAPSAPAAFGLEPFTFVGAAGDCGTVPPGVPYPAGTGPVTAKWDDSTGNPAPSILLEKLAPTTDCSAAGVDIVTPLEGQPITKLTELNFDYKNGEYCGAGAPRFNVDLSDGNRLFFGCAGGTHTPATDPLWTHVEYDAAQIQAALVAAYAPGPVPTNLTIKDIYIIFDEGPASVHIDNISVNKAVVGSPTFPTNANQCKNGGWKNTDYYPGFKNQGDCVSFVATKGKNPPAGPPSMQHS
jgi:hypothetical protein